MVKPVGVGDGSEEGEIPPGRGDEIEAKTEGGVGLGNLAQCCCCCASRRRDFRRHVVLYGVGTVGRRGNKYEEEEVRSM